MSKQRSTLIALTLLCALGMIWGSGYVIAKIAYMNGVPPMGYAFWQSFGPAMLLILIARFFTQMPKLNKRICLYYAVCGFLGIAVPNSIMYFAIGHIPTGIVAVIVNTVPIMTYPLALLSRQEHFSRWRLAGLIVGITGIFCLIAPQFTTPNSTELPWALFALLTPLCFALCALYINHKPLKEVDVLSLSAGMLCASTIFLLPVILLTHNTYMLHWPLSIGDMAILVEILLSSIGYVIFFLLLKHAGPVYYSMVGGIVSLTGLFWGYMIYGEIIGLRHTLAILLIFTGIFLVSAQQKKQVTHERLAPHPQPANR